MTIAGLYEWPDTLMANFDERRVGDFFSCPQFQGGVMGTVECRARSDFDFEAGLDPNNATDFVGIAPSTPADLVYPPAGTTVNLDLTATDFDPPPDYVAVRFSRIRMEGPTSYYTSCVIPAIYSYLTPGGCGGFTAGVYGEEITLPAGTGSIDGDDNVLPPPDLAYDNSDEGSKLWPFANLADAAIHFHYTGSGWALRMYGTIYLRLFWEVEQTPGLSTITLGNIARGVRRRVSVVT